MADPIRRGAIYRVNLGSTKGSEQAGVRPAVIVSNDVANNRATIVTVVPATTKKWNTKFPQHVEISSPFPEPSTILCEQVRTVTKDRLLHHMGNLSSAQMAKVDAALAKHLGLRLS